MTENNQKTILIVEDEVLIAMSEKNTLEKLGYNIITVASGEKAIAITAGNKKIDLILMDIGLGKGIDGIEAASQILKIKNIPIIFLTSHIEKEIVERVNGVARYGYVVKSSGEFVLQSSIEMALVLFESNSKIVKNETVQNVIISNISDVIVIINQTGIIKYQSHNINKCCCWKQQDIIGKKIWKFFHPDDVEKIKKEFNYVLSENKLPKSVECGYMCKDGSYKAIVLTITNLTENPVIKGILLNIHDISEQKKAEETLKETETRYRRLHESMTDCFCQVNMSGQIVEANRSFIEMLGYTEDELSKLKFTDLTPAKWHVFEQNIIDTQILPFGHSKVYEKEYINKNGKVFPVELRTYLLNDNNGTPSGMWAIIRDITEREKNEAELKETNDKLTRAQRLAHIGSWTDYLPTNELHWSEEMYNILGFPVNSPMTLKRASLVFPKDELERMQQSLNKTISENAPYSMDYKIIRSDGAVRYIHDEGEVVRDENGNALWMHGTTQDITERMQAEEALRESEKRLRSTLDNMIEGCQILGADWRYLYINDAAEKHNRRPKTELLGNKYTEMWPGIEKTEVFKVIKRCLEEQIGHIMENEFFFPDGNKGWFELRIQPVSDGVFILSNDITKRKLAEDEYKKLSRAITQSPISVVITNPNGNIEYANPKFLEITGYSIEEIFDKNINALYSVAYVNDSYKNIWNAVLNGDEWKGEVQSQKKNGELYWENISISPLFSEEGEITHFVEIKEDITERKKTESFIRTTLKEKEILLQELHHRTKNNMQIICSMLALQSMATKDKKITSILKEMENRIKSMALVHQKLYQAKNYTQIDLKEYISELSRSLISSYMTSNSKISLILELESIFVLIDSVIPCGLIINELITNSLKYAFPNERKGEICIRLKRSDEGEIQLTVSDDGIGIKNNLNLEEAQTLGLSLVINLAKDQLKGKLFFNTENGVKFHLSFNDNLYWARV